MAVKLSVVIAHADALPSAFVVFRGFRESIIKAAKLGFDGIEIGIKHPDEIVPPQLRQWLLENGMQVSCISTGQVFASLGLSFTEKNAVKRKNLKSIFMAIIDLAAQFGKLVNIGRVRGNLDSSNPEDSLSRFMEMTSDLCEYAEPRGVTLLLEPVNRYELNFINNLPDGAGLIRKLKLKNLKLMADVFHMNIEDRDIAEGIKKYHQFISTIHFADSNRLAPGWGHTNFQAICEQLKKSKYSGWISVEILPFPSPDKAASQAVKFLKPLFNRYFPTRVSNG